MHQNAVKTNHYLKNNWNNACSVVSYQLNKYKKWLVRNYRSYRFVFPTCAYILILSKVFIKLWFFILQVLSNIIFNLKSHPFKEKTWIRPWIQHSTVIDGVLYAVLSNTFLVFLYQIICFSRTALQDVQNNVRTLPKINCQRTAHSQMLPHCRVKWSHALWNVWIHIWIFYLKWWREYKKLWNKLRVHRRTNDHLANNTFNCKSQSTM